MDVHICDALVTHISRIEAIEKACFSVPWTADQIRSQLKDETHEFLAALDDAGRLLGYVGMMTVLDEGYIANVAVDPAYRRQGIADKLIERLLRGWETKAFSATVNVQFEKEMIDGDSDDDDAFAPRRSTD